jgi:hypothetical protein
MCNDAGGRVEMPWRAIFGERSRARAGRRQRAWSWLPFDNRDNEGIMRSIDVYTGAKRCATCNHHQVREV